MPTSKLKLILLWEKYSPLSICIQATNIIWHGKLLKSYRKSNSSPRIKEDQVKLEQKVGLAIFKIFWVRNQISLKISLSLPMEEISSELNIPTSNFTLDALKKCIKAN